eukprot:scaffold910_cov396-Prasinococcus_capsulatus_cf.AAC.49
MAGKKQTVDSFDLSCEHPWDRSKRQGPNVWPDDDVPCFRDDVYRFYQATTQLAQGLFVAFSEMLGLPRFAGLALSPVGMVDCGFGASTWECDHALASCAVMH